MRAAARPADEDHAYGHGKAESLAGLFQSSHRRFRISSLRIYPPDHQSNQINSEWVGVMMTMLVAVLVSIALVVRLRRVARETESPALSGRTPRTT